MKYIVFIGILLLLASCNTKYNMIDTGLVSGKFAGNMYEYLQSNSYDWDSTRLMIERADLVDLFEGKREGYEQITFFGPTNHSIRRYMIDKGIRSISEMPKDFCRDMIMRCVVKGKYMRNDIPNGTPAVVDAEREGENAYQGPGGVVLTGEMGNRFWIYSFQTAYNQVAGVGAVVLYMVSLETGGTKIDIGSTDIEPTNGVVHSLYYNFTLGDL